MSGHRHSHADGTARPRPSLPRASDARTPPPVRRAVRPAPPSETRATVPPPAASRQPWWQMAAFRHEGAVPRATFLRSFVFAWNGLRHAVLTQRNARVHAFLAAVAIALGIWLRISPVEFAIVFVAISGVFISEMFNTVAEACVDLITDQYHPLAKIAKDVAAGAVLLSALLAVTVGLFVYLPHLWPLVRHLLAR